MELKEWTVHELIDELSKYGSDYTITLQDADSMWTIPKFHLEIEDNNVHFVPCGYHEMKS